MKLLLFLVLGMSLMGCRVTNERYVMDGDKVAAIIFEENGKQGLKDSIGNILLPARFDHIEDFVECGVIKVDSGGRKFRDHDLVGYQTNKIGLIDAKGNVILKPQFDEINFAWFPLGKVGKDNRYGYINNKGVIKIPIKYLDATPFQNGFAVVRTESGYGLIDSTNAFIIEADKDSLDLAYVEGFSKDTMLIIINNFEKTLMINNEGKTFKVIKRNRN